VVLAGGGPLVLPPFHLPQRGPGWFCHQRVFGVFRALEGILLYSMAHHSTSFQAAWLSFGKEEFCCCWRPMETEERERRKAESFDFTFLFPLFSLLAF
jgi:hypothetical protein